MTFTGSGSIWDFADPESTPWSEYTDFIQILTVNEGVTSIGDFAMCEAVSLTEIRLPDSLISIGLRAFENCTGLTGDLVIPNGVEEIGIAAFNGDGIIDEADALYLLRHTLLPERYPIAAADTDYDRDGMVTANDAAWLKKQLDALLPTRD